MGQWPILSCGPARSDGVPTHSSSRPTLSGSPHGGDYLEEEAAPLLSDSQKIDNFIAWSEFHFRRRRPLPFDQLRRCSEIRDFFIREVGFWNSLLHQTITGVHYQFDVVSLSFHAISLQKERRNFLMNFSNYNLIVNIHFRHLNTLQIDPRMSFISLWLMGTCIIVCRVRIFLVPVVCCPCNVWGKQESGT